MTAFNHFFVLRNDKIINADMFYDGQTLIDSALKSLAHSSGYIAILPYNCAFRLD